MVDLRSLIPVLAWLVIPTRAATAAVPAVVSYQGELTNNVGHRVPDGGYYVTFGLFTAQIGGTAVWSESKSTEVRNGLLSTPLGALNPLPASAFERPLWLEISVNGSVLSPRVPLASVPYAMHAALADAVPVGSITSTQIAGSAVNQYQLANGSVTAAKLASGSVSLDKIAPDVVSGIASQVKQYYSVKDYGAKGDGITDDTRAIQATFDAAATRNWGEQWPGGSYYTSNATVFFPCGKYIVSDTVRLTGPHILGEGTPIIYQTQPSKDIFSLDWAWRLNVSGLTLVGGKDHFVLDTHNVDTTELVFSNCSFNRANGCAVRMAQGSNSTQITIRESTFIHCNQAFVNYCDKAKIVDCWVSTVGTMANRAVFENRGTLVLENLVLVPDPVAANDQRWVDNYLQVTCRNVRFGAESAGFTPIVNFAPYDYTWVGGALEISSVVLDNCQVWGSGNPARPGVIYCEEIPNQIIVRNCNGFGAMQVVTVRPTIDLNTYLDNAHPSTVRFLIGKENVSLSDEQRDLPEQMRPFQSDQIEGVAAPVTGNWLQGTLVRNRNFGQPGAPFGWVCTQSGKPGLWMAVQVPIM